MLSPIIANTVSIIALCVRILSNPAANALQKYLSKKHSAILINLYSYLFLTLACVFPASASDWSGCTINFWFYAVLAGILCTLGSVCLIKALQCGEMSVLGPINSYKCIVGLLFGYFLLGEMPTPAGILGVILIIWGSWYIFDTVNEGFSFKLLLRKDIVLRFLALFFTGCEAAVLKKIILLSSVKISFMLWCFMGLIFTFLLAILFRVKFERFSGRDICLTAGIALCLGLMQYSTNVVFAHINVGLSLALFQLSSLVAVLFGYLMFREGNLAKKLIGSAIMITGSIFILVI